MKKLYYILLIIIVLGVIALVVLRPRQIQREGYFFRTYEYVMFTDQVIKDPNGQYIPASNSRAIRVDFENKYNYLFDSLKQTPLLKVDIKGKYYPISVAQHLGKIGPKIYLEELIKSEVVTQ